MNTVDAVQEAIRKYRVATCTYQDHQRTIFPLVLLRDKHGRLAIHVWQIDGSTHSGRAVPCWENLDVDEIRDFATSGELFTASQIPAAYNPDRFVEKLCWVPKPPTSEA
jgi:hypothetical protein